MCTVWGFACACICAHCLHSCTRAAAVAAAACRRDVTQRFENSGDLVPTLPFGPKWRAVGIGRSVALCTTSASGSTSAAALRQKAQVQHALLSRRSLLLSLPLLRGAAAAAGGARSSQPQQLADAAEGAGLGFGIEDHMIGSYVDHMFSCLDSADQRRVPGPDVQQRRE